MVGSVSGFFHASNKIITNKINVAISTFLRDSKTKLLLFCCPLCARFADEALLRCINLCSLANEHAYCRHLAAENKNTQFCSEVIDSHLLIIG